MQSFIDVSQDVQLISGWRIIRDVSFGHEHTLGEGLRPWTFQRLVLKKTVFLRGRVR